MKYVLNMLRAEVKDKHEYVDVGSSALKMEGVFLQYLYLNVHAKWS